jgi:hypothetical protein
VPLPAPGGPKKMVLRLHIVVEKRFVRIIDSIENNCSIITLYYSQL